MEESDLLLTIAEVAVAFAGFAGLVGILGQRSSHDDPRVLASRMRGMIFFSLIAVAFSLAPPLLHRWGLEDETVWRVASLLFALALGGVVAWLAGTVTRLSRLDIPRGPVVRAIGAVLFPSLALAFLLVVVNALFVAPRLMPAVYLTALGLTLFLAGFAFCLILFSFLPRLRE